MVLNKQGLHLRRCLFFTFILAQGGQTVTRGTMKKCILTSFFVFALKCSLEWIYRFLRTDLPGV